AYITATFHPAALERLRRTMDVVHEDWRRTQKVYFSGGELAQRIRDLGADVLVVEADLVHEEVIEGCDLRIIGATRGDPINIRIDLASARKIPVFFAPARNAEAVAELTVGFMLCALRRIHEVYHGLRSGELGLDGATGFLDAYHRYTGFELEGKTVGIVGFGAIGQRVARILRGFGARVIAYDPYVAREVFESLGAERFELDPLVRESDVLTIHCPELPETFDLVNAERVRSLKAGAYVMNLGRARTLNEDALYEGLRSGRIAGAGLDVLSQEPVRPDNRFLALPNVVLMPHYGGNTHETVLRQSHMMVDGIEDFLAGKRPRYLCNPEIRES
ncbi:MAG: NAD(P)-dependent oxidoreductase, partial [Candidatus Binatia bacterium]